MSDNELNNPSPELERMATSLIDTGFLNASMDEIESNLGQRLQQELLDASKKGEQAPEWAQSTYGPKDIAKRFIDFQKNAIFGELCDPKRKKLKIKYEKLLSPTTSKAITIAGLTATLLTVFGLSAPQVAVPSVAAYVALWLLHADLEHLCSQSKK